MTVSQFAKSLGTVVGNARNAGVGFDELAAGNDLKLVQKYGMITRAIDAAACRERGIPVATQRRRSNIACAEHSIALMLDIAKKLHITHGLLSMEHGPYESSEGLNDGYTHGFLMSFDNAQSRDEYLPHPEHERVRQIVAPRLERLVVFDFVS
jgi:phosphoglycerate dehydrogenase-like enzyme